MMPLSNIFCLVCDVNVDISSGINILSTSFPHHGELLVNIVSKILRVATSELQDSYICLQCYNLFQMLEQAQKTVLNIRCEILNIYRATERRKTVKQSLHTDTKLNLTNIMLEEKKLRNVNENLKDGSSLEIIEVEEIVQQQCVQHNILHNNINVSNTDNTMINEIALEAKKHIAKKIANCNEINNIKPFDYNDTQKDIKEDAVLENNIIHASEASTCINNMYNINNAQVLESKKNEMRKSTETDAIFSDSRLQVQNINFKWKDIEDNIAEVKEDSENTMVTNVNGKKLPLQSEKISKHELKSFKYSCSTCDKRWKTAAELKTHIKTHSTLRPYMCEKCGQAYKHKHALEIHVGMHNGINPFQCTFCQKCFTQKRGLMRHLPMHTGEMPYQCELCGKRFIHHTSYNMHRLSHSGKKSYKCHMCDLSLLSTSHLKRHMRVHTGEKPYSCAVCGKRFAERYNLLAHQKIHNPLEDKTEKAKEMQYQVFRCNHCNLVFEQEQNLNEHIKQHVNANNKSDLEKSQCTVFQVEPEVHDLEQKIHSGHSVLQQTWIQMNRPKLDIIDNQGRFVLLQNHLPEIDDNSFAVTFGDQKVSLETTNYNTNLELIIEPPEASFLSNNLPSIDKMHM